MTTDGQLELFRQASENARAYMDLRFKHFGTFALITLALAGGAAKLDALEPYRAAVFAGGFVIAALFWQLDRRTGQYLRLHLRLAAGYAREIDPEAAAQEPAESVISASTVTGLLFTLAMTAWLVAGLVCLID